MTTFEELRRRGLLAQLTDEKEIEELVNAGKATFYIPSNLGYGENGTRGIEPNSTLIFEVEVLTVNKFIPKEEKKEDKKKPARK